MSELKPCPFCGGDAQLEHVHDGFGYSYVRCKKCGLESVKFIKSFEVSSDERAVEFWNRRADADCIRYMDVVDVAPVRHGRWKRYTKNLVECSKCGYVVSIRYKFCPDCGKKMDGERKENENV